MRRHIMVVAVLLCVVSWSVDATARSRFLSNPRMDTDDLATKAAALAGGRGCTFCHQTDRGGRSWNTFGVYIREMNPNWTRGGMDWDALGADDFDNDTFTTAIELMANPPSDPRDANSTPAPDPAPDMGMDMANADMGVEEDMPPPVEDMASPVEDMAPPVVDMAPAPQDMAPVVTPPADMGATTPPPADMSTPTPAPSPSVETDDEGGCAASSPAYPVPAGYGLLALVALVGIRRRL